MALGGRASVVRLWFSGGVSCLSAECESPFGFLLLFSISVVGCSSVCAVPSRLFRRFVLCVELVVFFYRAQVLFPVCSTFPSIS